MDGFSLGFTFLLGDLIIIQNYRISKAVLYCSVKLSFSPLTEASVHFSDAWCMLNKL